MVNFASETLLSSHDPSVAPAAQHRFVVTRQRTYRDP